MNLYLRQEHEQFGMDMGKKEDEMSFGCEFKRSSMKRRRNEIKSEAI
jgi:hypothetical protein